MLKHTLESPARPARVVILGASGFVGRYLAEQLAADKVEVLGLTSKDLDLASRDASQKLGGILRKDDVLVFASCITRDKGDDLPVFVKNMIMAEQVGLCVEKAGCAQVVYLSSDAVYKDGISPVREDSECGPAGLYPMAQYAREAMITHSTAKAKVPLAILRLCAVYGKGDSHNGYGPNRFARMAAEKGKITLFGEGEETRDHIFVKDVCRVIALCVSHRSTGVLNVVTGKAVSFMEAAQAVVQAKNGAVTIEVTPRKSPITHRHFDNAALIKAFPTFAFTELLQGVKETIN